MKAKVLIAWKAKVHKYLFLRKGEMKMSYWKKALSIGLAAVMTASMLAGCGSGNSDTKDKKDAAAATKIPRNREGIPRGHRRQIRRKQQITEPLKILLLIKSRLCAGQMHGLWISWKAAL